MPRTVLFLVRHGARHDYGNPSAWRGQVERNGLERSDPPLSALGHQQAREVAAALKDEGIDLLLCSPYLRVLQTAQPLAHALNLPLNVENSLAEFHHCPSRIPPPGTRVALLPEVDGEYRSVLPAFQGVDAETGEEPVVEYLRRQLFFASEGMSRRFVGRTVACFSHAASVALVAALTGCATLSAAGTFAPCGIYKLVSEDGGATWEIERRGDDNTGHITENHKSTFPWGFQHSKDAETHDADWQRARALGPSAVAPAPAAPAAPAAPSRRRADAPRRGG